MASDRINKLLSLSLLILCMIDQAYGKNCNTGCSTHMSDMGSINLGGCYAGCTNSSINSISALNDCHPCARPSCCHPTTCNDLPTNFQHVTSENCIACNGGINNTSTGLESYAVCQLDCVGRTIFIPRSVGANTARELVGWQAEIHRRDPKGWYLSWAEAVGGSRSFRGFRIAQYLFGNKIVSFSGSQAPKQLPGDWLADYFGLPTNFRGVVEFDPRIDNAFLDTQFFLGLDRIFDGFYMRFHLPLVHTRWSLNPCERIKNPDASETIPGCYMADEPVPAARNLRQALSGSFATGDIAPRRFANICFGTLSKTRFADLDVILGIDIYRYNEYQLGLYAQFVAPLGNRPDPRFLFSPIVGNAKHFEAGAGLSGRMLLYQWGPDTSLNIYLEGNVTHLFKTRNVRTFDFCNNGLFSRYLLLKEYLADGVTYAGRTISAADFTTRAVTVSVPVKGDVSAKLAYRTNWIDVDLGYNFYGHHSEKLCLDEKCNIQAKGLYGIKGTEGVCYTEYAVNPDGTFGTLVGSGPLNSTQSNATIYGGALTDNPITPPVINPGDVTVAWNNTRTTGSITGPDIILAQNSNPPVLVRTRDLNLKSGTACEFATHKFFMYVGKTYDNYWCDKTGYFGLAVEAEFEALARNERSSLNQWSIYLKGGLSY